VNLRELFYRVNVILEIPQKNDLICHEIPEHIHELDVAFKTLNIKAHCGVPFKRGNDCWKDTIKHKWDYERFLEFIFLVM